MATIALGMRPMQERAYEKRGEQYLLIKSPPASGKSRALMFIALDKLHNQGLKQAIIVVPEKAIGVSFYDEPLSKFGFWADWYVEPKWNLCDAPGADNGGKVNSLFTCSKIGLNFSKSSQTVRLAISSATRLSALLRTCRNSVMPPAPALSLSSANSASSSIVSDDSATVCYFVRRLPEGGVR